MRFFEFIPSIHFGSRPKESMQLFDNFDSALADSDTYEDPGVIQVVTDKTKSYKISLSQKNERYVGSRQIAQNLFVLSHIYPNKELNILEIGGACGAAYLDVRHFLPSRVRCWHILETPAMAASGKKFFQDEALKFFENLEHAVSGIRGGRDLLIAQGVLQYLRDPIKTFRDLLKLDFEYIYITRTIVGENLSHPIITQQVVDLSQHGPGPAPAGFADRKTSQPLTILPFESFKPSISEDYNIKFIFDEGDMHLVRIASRKIKTKMMGFLLERNRDK